MPSIEDFKLNLQRLRDALQTELPRIAETLTTTAKALSERQIKEQGFGEKYSTNRIPAFFLHDKELNQSGLKYLQAHGVGNPKAQKGTKKPRKGKSEPIDRTATWGEFRAAQGLQSEHVDGSYSNKMWANMQPVKTEEDNNGIFRSYLGATNKEAQDKMNYMYAMYGDFIRKGLTEESGRLLGEYVIGEVGNVLEQFKP